MKVLADSFLETVGAGHKFDPDLPMPLYYQLYALLKDHILDGTIGYGSKLPTEQQLGHAFGLSRITVKRAMDDLAAEELVERRRGRGTSVIHQYKPKVVNAPLVEMLEGIENMGRNTKARVLDLANKLPPAEIREQFGLEANKKLCYLSRVRLSEKDSTPFAYYESWTKAPVGCFTKSALRDSTRIELLRKHDITLSRIDQFLSASAAITTVAEALKLKPKAPLLVLVRHSFDAEGNLVDILQGSYNPDMFRYQMSMHL